VRRLLSRLEPPDKDAWTPVNDKIATALGELRATSPDPTSEHAALNELLGAL